MLRMKPKTNKDPVQCSELHSRAAPCYSSYNATDITANSTIFYEFTAKQGKELSPIKKPSINHPMEGLAGITNVDNLSATYR